MAKEAMKKADRKYCAMLFPTSIISNLTKVMCKQRRANTRLALHQPLSIKWSNTSTSTSTCPASPGIKHHLEGEDQAWPHQPQKVPSSGGSGRSPTRPPSAQFASQMRRQAIPPKANPTYPPQQVPSPAAFLETVKSHLMKPARTLLFPNPLILMLLTLVIKSVMFLLSPTTTQALPLLQFLLATPHWPTWPPWTRRRPPEACPSSPTRTKTATVIAAIATSLSMSTTGCLAG